MQATDQAVVDELVGNAHGNLSRVTAQAAAPIHGAVMGKNVEMVRPLKDIAELFA